MKKPTKPILIFGGRFDPFHNGHFRMLEMAVQQLDLKKVILIPSHLSVVKPASFFSKEKRLDMLLTLLPFLPQPKTDLVYDICDIELQSQTPQFTKDTLLYLKQRYKDTPLWILVGSDSFFSIHTWKNSQEWIQHYKWVVVEREDNSGMYLDEKFKTLQFHVLKGNPVKISSTHIREMIQEKRDVSAFVPAPILPFLT